MQMAESIQTGRIRTFGKHRLSMQSLGKEEDVLFEEHSAKTGKPSSWPTDYHQDLHVRLLWLFFGCYFRVNRREGISTDGLDLHN
jgi:hypothetical protein